MHKRIFRLTYMIFIVTFVLASCKANNEPAASDRVNEGSLAPMFQLEDIDENTISLEDYTGEKVYIKYWASWCSVCLAGLEEIDKLSEADQDFNVFTIVSPNYKGEMNQQDFKEWFRSLEYDNITVLMDIDGVWADQFNLLAYPTSYFIGTDGVLSKTLAGQQSNEIITSEMEKIF